MNMLIIGNGFDLAHGRPTKYEDFLKFLQQIMRTKSFDGTKDEFEATMPDLHTDVKNYVLSAFETRAGIVYETVHNKNNMIQKLQVDSVLSFNYTDIPTNIYPSLTNMNYIHGFAEAKRSAVENNMVLGVNEYWEDSEKNFRTNFNLYKKFVQRIIKETGIGYKKALGVMHYDYEDEKKYGRLKNGHVYIFGHSLDVTDGDILREIIRTPGVITTVFYKDKQQQANQIANLSKVLGQDELLKRTFSTSPTIIFQQQAEMASV